MRNSFFLVNLTSTSSKLLYSVMLIKRYLFGVTLTPVGVLYKLISVSFPNTSRVLLVSVNFGY